MAAWSAEQHRFWIYEFHGYRRYPSALTNAYANSQCNADAHSYADTDSNPRSDSNPNANPNSNSNSNSNSYIDSDATADGYTNANTEDSLSTVNHDRSYQGSQHTVQFHGLSQRD